MFEHSTRNGKIKTSVFENSKKKNMAVNSPKKYFEFMYEIVTMMMNSCFVYGYKLTKNTNVCRENVNMSPCTKNTLVQNVCHRIIKKQIDNQQ